MAVRPSDTIAPFTKQLLKQYGLESLTNWAILLIQDGASEAQIEIALWETPEFKNRFSGIFVREKAGLPPISPAEYLEYEFIARQLSSTWDIPLNQSEINDLIGLDVSARELEERFNIASTAVYLTPPEDRAEFQRLFGVTTGQLAKYWMDPKKEFPLLQQQFVAGRIAGAAVRSGFGQITAEQATRLYQTGMQPEQAVEGFGQLYEMREVFQPIDATEEELTRDQQIGLLAGDSALAQLVETRARRRQAEFAGGGEFAAGQEGFKGTGAATP